MKYMEIRKSFLKEFINATINKIKKTSLIKLLEIINYTK